MDTERGGTRMQHTVRQIDKANSHRHADTDMHSQTPLRLLRREGADAGVKKAKEMVLRESTGKEERGIEERRDRKVHGHRDVTTTHYQYQ
jgi:hypothetical protein